MLRAAFTLLLAACALAQGPIAARANTACARVDAAELERTVKDLVAFHTRHVASTTADDKTGTGAARAYLEQRLRHAGAAAGERLVVERKAYRVPSTRLRGDAEVVNVMTTLRGTTDPSRVYVIGGHYDSINADTRDSAGAAPGANDDASGTAVVLEALRALATEPLAATILFVCYDGEEMGLLGSAAHAKELADAKVNVDGMITNDIVGNTLGMDGKREARYLRCFSYAERGNDTAGRSLARVATYAVHAHVPEFSIRLVLRGDRYGRGGDHKSFFSAGFPAVRFSEAREDFSRQHANVGERDGQPYGDLPEFVDFAYLAKVCRANVATLIELASAPPAPTSVRARGARRAYDTTVTWKGVEAAASYELVWRATTAADWEGSKLLTKDEVRAERGQLAATLSGQCLDDVVVGVRSVSADGARSRVATPSEPDAFDMRR